MSVTARGKAKPPICSHPAFPAIVALWFAALLGVGSMVLPAVLLEKLAVSTGLAAILPAAQPPLGATARILIALVSAGIGVVAGLAIARRVVAAQKIEQPRKRAVGAAPQPAKRPLSAREELGIDNLDAALPAAPAPLAGRRRSLSLSDEDGRSDFFESAPLPGHDPYASPADASDPLDLGGFAEDEGVGDDAREPEPISSDDSIALEAAAETEQRQVFVAAEPEPDADLAAQNIMDEARSESEMPMPNSSTFAPLASQPAAERRFDAAPELAEEAAPEPPPVQPAGPVSERPLRELGMAELVERFACSLQRRAAAEEAPEEPLPLPPFKAERAAPPAAEPAVPAPYNPFADRQVEPEDQHAYAAHEAVEFAPMREPDDHRAPEPRFAAETTAPPEPAVPAALRPIAFDEDDGEEEADAVSGLSLALDPQIRPFARPVAEPAAADEMLAEPSRAALSEAGLGASNGADESQDDNESESEGYSSLLAMKRPLGSAREFVRIEEDESESDDVEPVVVFPGQQQQRRAAPASDGPSREPLSQPTVSQPGFRPFDGPVQARQATYADFAPAMPTRPPEKRADPAETERALRDALEKLQRLSGAA